MRTRPNRATPAPASAPSASQSARDLAYRRWRPESTAATAPAKDPSAQFLAHHRWGTARKTGSSPAPISDAATSSGGAFDNGDLGVLIGLAAVASLVYSARKERAASRQDAAASSADLVLQARAAPALQEDWLLLLAGGSMVVAVLILVFSGSARRNWALISGAEALLLAATWPV